MDVSLYFLIKASGKTEANLCFLVLPVVCSHISSFFFTLACWSRHRKQTFTHRLGAKEIVSDSRGLVVYKPSGQVKLSNLGTIFFLENQITEVQGKK